MDEATLTRSNLPTRPAPIHQQSRSSFKNKAGNFWRRLSSFTQVPSNKKTKGASSLQSPYQRQARSTDAMPKSYMSQPMLALSSLDQDGQTGFDESPPSTSASNSPRNSSQTASQQQHNGRSTISGLPPSSSRRPHTSQAFGAPRSLASLSGIRSAGPDGRSNTNEQGLILDSYLQPGRVPASANSRNPSLAMTSSHTQQTRRLSFKLLTASPPLQNNKYPSGPESASGRPNMTVTMIENQTEARSSKPDEPTPPTPRPETARSLRRAAPRLKSLPPSVLTRLTVDGTRLSPSIAPRPTPMPILNLPQLPPRTPAATRENMPPRARLASVPALPLYGPTDRDMDSDHEDAALDEEDEDDEDAEGANGAASDDEDMDGREGSSLRAGVAPQAKPSLSVSPAQGSSQSSHTPQQPTPGRQKYELPPLGSNLGAPFDYFSIRLSDAAGNDDLIRNPGRTPRETGATEMGLIPRHPRTLRQVMPLPMTGSARPNIYRHASRSCIDLFSTTQDGDEGDRVSSSKGKGKARELSPEIGSSTRALRPGTNGKPMEPQTIGTTAPENVKHTHTLRRRRSMPTFNTTTLPPPYPEFAPLKAGLGNNVVIQPRDEEGMERLPAYSNSIYLKAIMPRKLEFSQPGVQARDRKWRRVLCVLEGTAFKVYKCPPGAAGVSVIGEWWEKKVGVGDVSVPIPAEKLQTRAEVASQRRDSERVRKLESENGPEAVLLPAPAGESSSARPQTSQGREKKKKSPSSFLRPQSAHGRPQSSNARLQSSFGPSHGRSRSDAMPASEAYSRSRPSLSMSRGSQTPSERSSLMSSPVNSQAGSSMISATASRRASVSSSMSSSQQHFMAPSCCPEPEVDESSAELIHAYTVQNAESGLGNDYLKRKNVIRVRMEGEQFLLQAQNVSAVVEWIEGFHAATNVALDLDVRPMPKGPMFPRRRRRRPRPADSERPADS